MVRVFQNQQINRLRWRLPFAIRFLVIVSGWWETENWKMKQMVMKFPPLGSERKKRTTSGDSLQFPNGFSGKLLFHFTFNRNFLIFFLLNGKHPMYQFLLFILCTLNTSEVYKVNTFSMTSVLEKALSFATKCIFLQFRLKIVCAFAMKQLQINKQN